MSTTTPTEPDLPTRGRTWTSFADFLLRRDDESEYLCELNHAAASRRTWSAQQWWSEIEAVALWLQSCGIGPGDVVATLGGNTPGALRVAFGCWLAGACLLPLSVAESLDRKKLIVGDADARLITYATDHAEEATQLATETGAETFDFDEIIGAADMSDTRRLRRDVPLSAPALRVYTSGTTGAPKGVVLTAANLIAHTEKLSEATGWTSADRVITVLPIHHVNGLLMSCLMPWYLGASTVLCDRFRSDTFFRDAEAETASVSSLVPSILEFLLQGGTPHGYSTLREVLSGAGPLLPQTVVAFEDTFGIPVRHCYGLSETTAVAAIIPDMPDAERRALYTQYGFPSIGTPLDGVEIAVLDTSHAAVSHEVRGQLAVRGATVMQGYSGPAENNAKAFVDGWFLTGDEGMWRPSVYGPMYFVTGRMKELIIRGGVNIAPVEIDTVINAHPAVTFGLAVPFANRFYGEEIAAYVVADNHFDEAQFLEYCAYELGHERSPKVVLVGHDVPYTSTGKPKRIELAATLADDLRRFESTQFRRRPTDFKHSPTHQR